MSCIDLPSLLPVPNIKTTITSMQNSKCLSSFRGSLCLCAVLAASLVLVLYFAPSHDCRVGFRVPPYVELLATRAGLAGQLSNSVSTSSELGPQSVAVGLIRSIDNRTLPSSIPSADIYSSADSHRCKIYTYFAAERGRTQAAAEREELLLIQTWKKSWWRKGWEPVVLNATHAEQHPEYPSLLPKLSSLPTVNAPFYELQCYLRWLAMATVGGGYMIDYDITNLDFPPPADRDCGTEQPLTSYRCVHPMLTWGNGSAFLDMARAFASYDATGLNHTSDMKLARHVFGSKFLLLPDVPKITHFNHDAVRRVLNMVPGDAGRLLQQMGRSDVAAFTSSYDFAEDHEFELAAVPASAAAEQSLMALWGAVAKCTGIDGSTGSSLPSHSFSQELLSIMAPGEHVPRTPVAKKPFRIVMLPPSPAAAMAARFLAAQGNSDRPSLWGRRGLRGAPGGADRGAASVSEFVDSWRNASSGALGGDSARNPTSRELWEQLEGPEGSQVDVVQITRALTASGTFFFPLDRAREALSVLEYEAGVALPEPERSAVTKRIDGRWQRISEQVGRMGEERQRVLSEQGSRDAAVLKFAMDHFSRRVQVVQRLQAFINAS